MYSLKIFYQIYVFLIALLLFNISIIFAQEAYPTLYQIKEAFNNLSFTRTIELSTRAIKDYQNYSVVQLVQIYQYRALAYYNLGSEQEAAEAFKLALSLDPGLELDPVTVSPKIRNFFADIKAHHATIKDVDENTGESRFIIRDDVRPQAAWRSMILPGWGQLHKGQETKGYLIFSGFVLNSVGLIAAVISERSARDAYMNAVQPAEIEARYQEYNKWNNIRRILTGTGIAIWLYAFGDALWSPTQPVEGISVTVLPSLFSATIAF